MRERCNAKQPGSFVEVDWVNKWTPPLQEWRVVASGHMPSPVDMTQRPYLLEMRKGECWRWKTNDQNAPPQRPTTEELHWAIAQCKLDYDMLEKAISKALPLRHFEPGHVPAFKVYASYKSLSDAKNFGLIFELWYKDVHFEFSLRYCEAEGQVYVHRRVHWCPRRRTLVRTTASVDGVHTTVDPPGPEHHRWMAARAQHKRLAQAARAAAMRP